METIVETNGTETVETMPVKAKQDYPVRIVIVKEPINDDDSKQDVPPTENSSGFGNTSKFPDSVYQNLPEPIKVLLSFFDKRGRQRDIFFFSLLHVLSACIPKVFGVYFGKYLSPNMYGMVGGPSGTGKSAMETALTITEPIIKRYEVVHK